jgi:hypothetical protein
LVNQLLESHQLVAVLLVGLLGVGAAQVIELSIEGEEHWIVLFHWATCDADVLILRLP